MRKKITEEIGGDAEDGGAEISSSDHNVDNKPYIGRVSDVDDDIHIDFMAPYVKENSLSQTFQWPPRSDNVWVKKI